MKIAMRKDLLFTHVGLLLDDNTVLHYGSKTNNMFARDQEVLCSTYTQFANHRCVVIRDVCINVQKDTLFMRMEEIKKSNSKYHILRNNCISFVLMCLYGRRISVVEMTKSMIAYRISPLAMFVH